MIVFDAISKTFPDGKVAVEDLSLTVDDGQVVVFLGTSGSGKTTALKLINRLIEPTKGRILVSNVDVKKQNIFSLRRSMGYAVQDDACFDHMTVLENLEVVLKLNHWNTDKIEKRIDYLLELVNLEPKEFLYRYPFELSGGQKQRVGVARALAADPPILLMDEPFSALDPMTREQLQNEFIDLVFQLKKTVVFVTHDLFEALKIANKIAIFHEGKLQQFSTPQELVLKPKNAFVDQFLGPHRFQLILHAETIKSQLKKLKMNKGKISTPEHLLMRHSLLEALDYFKTTNEKQIPIFEGKEYVGHLTKQNLMEIINTIIKENV
ncbi:MAG: Carnitine transport ATP-binding protein OpuCA [Chlamydiae bacterium]|nr:Carnitine transport ATP-binding protein OpuCA [Chlamydiota bacterium]